MIMAVAVMLIAPAIMGAFSPQGSMLVSQQACAVGEEEGTGTGNGSCCPRTAICGLNGVNYSGYHFVDGSCPDEDE